tara:strand:+ start:2507 stop:2941 length:435 start_codon:yes stop_codon:yes gene_type:complete
MTKKIKSISFVCIANYCRSPVAEMLLKNKYGKSFEIDSAGINPMVSAGMDPRSVNYLKEKNVCCEIHNPRKVDKSFFNSSDIVFAMDTFVLLRLNKMFKNYSKKIKLFSYQHRNLNIKDPYKFSEENYVKTMDDINFVIESFKF